jgi:hypothetical protein
MILNKETERSCFEQQFPVPEWAAWNDTEQAYVKREDFICSATALAMYRKAYQAWVARAALERKP